MISTKERRAMILQQVLQKDRVTIDDLKRQFNISEVSLRKDLNTMHDAKLLIRTRGGAMKIPDTENGADIPISTKQFDNVREKEGIGKLAATLINEGETVFLDSGTTTLQIARNLKRFKNLTVVTNALNVALELLKSGILTADDVFSLVNKYDANVTMLRLISKHAKELADDKNTDAKTRGQLYVLCSQIGNGKNSTMRNFSDLVEISNYCSGRGGGGTQRTTPAHTVAMAGKWEELASTAVENF